MALTPPIPFDEKMHDEHALQVHGLQHEPSHLWHVEETQHIQRGLESRHAQLIAIGGAIGTSLFVGTGQIMGFALGYLYWYSLGVLVPYEITAASLVVDYWDSPIPLAALITIMLVLIVVLNLSPVSVYGETEFWFVSLKIILIVGLIIVSIVLCFGGGPAQHGKLGFRYWNDPGAVNEYLVGGAAGRLVAFLQTLVLASFAFVLAPEQLIITAGEMKHPRKNLPRAAKTYFVRLVVFFIFGVIAIGIVAPSDDPRLTNGSAGAGSSPFVVGISNAGIRALGSVVNAGILASAWSAGNAFLYASSRSLYSLAVAGNAPAIFLRCNRWGVPYVAVGFSALFSLLSYLNVVNSSAVVFNWLVNITNTSGFISWICCMICFFRFRKAAKQQGVHLPYTNKMQPYGAWFSLILSVFLLFINGFTVFFPGKWSAANFLTAYVGIPAFMILYIGHRVAHLREEPWLRKVEDVDLVSELEEVSEPTQV